MRKRPPAVIGATGFIGSRLVSGLRRAGHEPASFNRTRPPVTDGRPAPGLREAEIAFFLATRTTPALAEYRPGEIAAERALLISVLEEVAKSGHRPVFVLASSGGTVYAPHAWPPHAESAPTGPTSAYGRAKLQLERDLLHYADRVQPVVLRLGNVYGPGQRPTQGFGVLANWLAAAARDEPVRLIGDPQVVRDYVHVDDVTGLLATLHRYVREDKADRVPAILNVGSGVPTSLAELLDIVSASVGRELTVIRERGRHFDQRSTWLDSSLAAASLGWRATTGLDEGVRQYWKQVTEAQSSVDVIGSL
ncbi:NAD-dependent epimerase/dehydratase family protein [Spongiactinospora sp. TRM90649]|uniref:NAD-dependent epimerase/dehydratase family protein n=1 Tax=Spongiactinospora sp. TRM90649 TaxID=3031114 RepID=UPI0023F8FEDA|nr:NAD-dependent epimerase/dehydratase family protein [Spongiactinospora sp. TRM90649]MDF5753499.1 NAD-dependent epimerase/dehydratase family protein [Spongiactinospora sp. TRM90649]